jgi:hypothetical protein
MSPLLKILGAVLLIFAGVQFTKGKDGPIESDLPEFANWIIPKEVLGRWRQVNALTAGDGLLETMYFRYPDWLEVHQRLNSRGVFNSPFTDRVGISGPRFTP